MKRLLLALLTLQLVLPACAEDDWWNYKTVFLPPGQSPPKHSKPFMTLMGPHVVAVRTDKDGPKILGTSHGFNPDGSFNDNAYSVFPDGTCAWMVEYKNKQTKQYFDRPVTHMVYFVAEYGWEPSQLKGLCRGPIWIVSCPDGGAK